MKTSTLKDTPLYRAISTAHRKLTSSATVALVTNLQRLAKSGRTFGTLSSGTDAVALAMKMLAIFWLEEYGIDVRWQQSFACECDRDKIKFLLSTLDDDVCLYEDNGALNQPSAQCCRHNDTCPVVHVNLATAGFCCHSRSASNNSRSSNAGCVRVRPGRI